MTDTRTERSAGHLIVAQLEREGVERVYCVPGESYLDVLDGLHDSAIDDVVTRHEGGAGFMALAEGRLTGRPGVALVTRGPGAANAFIAVHTAHQDATPLVLMVGLIPIADRGREAFQEFDLTAWFGSTAKHVVTLEDPASAARVVAESMRIARSGRPGPVVIGLPEDVIRLSASGAPVLEPTPNRPVEPSDAAIAELDERLSRAERPLVIVGGDGWSAEAGRSLAEWAAAQAIPVAADFRAWDAVPHDVDAYVGALGYGRADSLARLVDDADLVLLVGCPRTDVMSDGYRLAQDAETVVVMAGAPLGHSGRLDQLVTADPAGFARALPQPRHRFAEERLRTARAAHERFSTPAPALDASVEAATDFVDVTAVMAVLRDELTDDAIITFGAGNHAIWPSRYLPHHVPGTLLAPRNGAMGMGIPAAVAAGLVHPGREIVSVAGDGCFLMNGQEIATAIGYGVAFVAIVVDNGVFATIREHQEHHYPDRPSGTHLTNPDFADLARSFGGFGATVRSIGEFRDAFRAARASGLPAVLHVRQDPTVRAPRTNDEQQETA